MNQINKKIEIGPQISNLHNDWEIPFVGLTNLPFVLGLTGPTKSNKTRIAERLATEYGFKYLDIDGLISYYSKMVGIGIDQPDWEGIGKIARKIREMEGIDFFARLVMQRIRKDARKSPLFVVDGILHPDEVNYLKRKNNFILIGVTATMEIRIEEYIKWYGRPKELAESYLNRRDYFEQFNVKYQDKNKPGMDNLPTIDKYFPNVDFCLRKIHKNNLIHIEKSISEETLFNPLNKIMEEIYNTYPYLQRYKRVK